MATLTLKYNPRNSQINSLIEAIVSAGAQIVDTKETETLKAYQQMFGKRKNDEYTDNEVFVFNSMRGLAPILERYED